ncbi:MAG: L,D-transpeptidase [Anaerolineae bacterium]|nr:L,D-transpeptidase [Anaerolineae bacterium]MDQ7034365.1 L,D-transpeptidase [Anaerolineae bacterium]
MKRYLTVVLLIMLMVVPTIAQDEVAIGVTPEVIAQYPEPNIRPLVVDPNLIYDRAYRRVEGNLAMYDAGGNLVNDMGEGYNYVTLSGAMTQGDWTQIAPDRWVPTSNLSEDVAISRYAGVRLPEEGLPYTMAWTLRHLNPSETPGGEQSDNNPFLYRYTRVSIYATVQVEGYDWYQVGENQWIHQFNVAKIVPIERPADVNTDKWISVDLYEQVLIAYEDDIPVFATLIASGLPEWSTNEGTFNVYLRRERTTMSGAYNRPDFYYLEEVPWTMFFDGDIALHGTFWHDKFGYRQSHGCVNMSITDANWIYEWSSDVRDFSVEDSPDLSVHVYSSGEYS